ncbi:MAG TPA: penicillin acylase family protein, partial [bacterium]|nr:penicillin acylase family protein [bacterium]
DWDGDAEVQFADDVAKASTLTTGLRAGFAADTLLHFTPSETIDIVNPTMNATALPRIPLVPSLPRKSIARARAIHDALSHLPLAAHFMRRQGLGSNNWVVSGAKSATGHPILCNDPHLDLSAPSVWYELHWNTAKYGGDLDVTGVSFPGIPSIVIGANGHVAWGVTNVGPDATDTYVEHYRIGTGSNGADQVLWDDDGPAGSHAPAYVNLVKDSANIVVRQADGSTTTIVDTVWLVPQRDGVIVPGSLVVDTSVSLVTGTALSWSWTGFQATNEFKTFFALAHAHNAADVRAADANFDTPPQNMVYADSAGNIGYTAGGWYPVRGDDDGDLHTDPPYLPMPGYDGAHEWVGRLDATQWPHEENPTRGWEASSNQDPLGTVFDGDPVNDAVYLGALDWDIGFRGARIARVINSSVPQEVDIGFMEVLQADHHSNFAARMLPKLLPLVQATHPGEAQSLAAWGDRGYLAASGVGDNVPPDEVDDAAATSLFNTWMVAARIRAFHDEEAATGMTLDTFTAARTMLFLLEHPDQSATYDSVSGESILWDDMTTPQTETASDVFNAALVDALNFLASPQGFNSADPTNWRWGLLHTLTLSRQSGLSPFDIPNGVDAAHYPNGYPRHSDLFNVDVGNFGLDDDAFAYTHGASMRQIVDMTPGHMRFYNQIPGGISADPQSPHYFDRAEEYAKNITRETWYRESDVAGHGKSRVQFTP